MSRPNAIRWLALSAALSVAGAQAQTVVDASGRALAPDELAKIIEIIKFQPGAGPAAQISALRPAAGETNIYCGRVRVGGSGAMPFYVNTRAGVVWILFEDLPSSEAEAVANRISIFGCLP